MNRRFVVYLALLTQVLINSSGYLIAKYALQSFTPWEVMLLRYVFSVPLFTALLLRMPAPKLPGKPLWKTIILLSLLGIPLGQGLFLYGLKWSTPVHAALLYALTPLLILSMAVIKHQERVNAPKLLGIVVALVGVILVLNEHGLGDNDHLRLGDGMLVLAVICWALYSVWGKQLAQEQGAVRLTSWVSIVGSLMALPFLLWAMQPAHFAHASAGAWASVVAQGVCTSFLSYVLWYYALEHIEASKASVWLNFQPVLTAVFSYLVLSTPLSLAIAVGGTLVIGGVFLTQRG